MKPIDEICYDITIEYNRLIKKTGQKPSYLIVNYLFFNDLIYMLNKVYLNLDDIKQYRYLDMEIKRSFDLNKDEFILSFNKYQL